jgi:RHS repeat-associated protein
LTVKSINLYFLGKLIIAEGYDVSTDRLGSVRNGSQTGYEAQYPYGVEYTTTVNDREKFATYTRDSATGLDYAVNRYYSSQWGRFLSPDPSGLNVSRRNPQSWNLYAYVNNDPIAENDPSGYGPGFCVIGKDSEDDDPVMETFCFFDEGGGGGGGPSPGPGVLQQALSNAQNALQNKDCGALFNTKANPATVYSPAEALEGIVDGIKLGDEYFGSLWAENLAPTFDGGLRRTVVPSSTIGTLQLAITSASHLSYSVLLRDCRIPYLYSPSIITGTAISAARPALFIRGCSAYMIRPDRPGCLTVLGKSTDCGFVGQVANLQAGC